MHQLPALPDAIRVLRQDESDRLQALHPDLPKSLAQCVTCSGKKTFRWWDNYGDNEMQVVDYECPCQDQFLLYKYLLNSGLGKQAARMFLIDAEHVSPDVLAAMFEYEESAEYYVSRGIGLLLHGTHGNGKTLIASLLLKRLLADGVNGYFSTFTQMLDTYASGWRSDEHRQWFDRKVRNAPLLVVDDIGREHKGRIETSSSSLDTVFRSRVQNALPTIITTNLSLDEFERAYSSGVMSLVTESSITQLFQGEDWRPKQKLRTQEEIKAKLSRPITIGW